MAEPGDTCRHLDLAHPFGEQVAVAPRAGELVHLVGEDRCEDTVACGDEDCGQAELVGGALGPGQQAGLAHPSGADVDAHPAGEASLERDPGRQTVDVGELGLAAGDLTSGSPGGRDWGARSTSWPADASL